MISQTLLQKRIAEAKARAQSLVNAPKRLNPLMQKVQANNMRNRLSPGAIKQAATATASRLVPNSTVKPLVAPQAPGSWTRKFTANWKNRAGFPNAPQAPAPALAPTQVAKGNCTSLIWGCNQPSSLKPLVQSVQSATAAATTSAQNWAPATAKTAVQSYVQTAQKVTAAATATAQDLLKTTSLQPQAFAPSPKQNTEEIDPAQALIEAQEKGLAPLDLKQAPKTGSMGTFGLILLGLAAGGYFLMGKSTPKASLNGHSAKSKSIKINL